MRTTLTTLFSVALAAAASACSGPPASPFDAMKTSNVTIFRLQNYEPQAAATPAPGISMVPPQIQQWLGAGASMLPPGLIPPGLLPGTQTAGPMADAQRFNGFRILAQTSTVSDKDKGELADILGHDSNFDDTFSSCMYAEFGIREERVGAPPVDVLISLSCDRVQAANFAWPHKNQGLKSKTVERLTKVMRDVWGG